MESQLTKREKKQLIEQRRLQAQTFQKNILPFRDVNGMPRCLRCDLVDPASKKVVAQGYAFCSLQENVLEKREGIKRAIGRAVKAYAQARSYALTGVNVETTGQREPSKLLDVLYTFKESELATDPNLLALQRDLQDFPKGYYLG